MAGIYVHIPFCKSRCIYCGFFSTTSLEKRDVYVDAVCAEIKSRKDYLKGEDVETIYFGGGTPSMLSPRQIGKILSAIYNIYKVRANAEITIECNPDDLTSEFLADIHQLGFNRLSVGIQTFNDRILCFLHRRHSALQAVAAMHDAVDAGFHNISVDLMFGFPGQTIDEWKDDVNKALKLPVQHISAYSLMYDEGTMLTSMLNRGLVNEIDDTLSLEMYKYLVETLKSAGFDHYEISNFSRPGFSSRHNSSYWHSIPYLGVGAGAHSYDGDSRQYNVESLNRYIAGAEPIKENLTLDEKYNEFVFTGLRTSDGISLDELLNKFGSGYYEYCISNARKHLTSDRMTSSSTSGGDNILRLSPSGIYISNDIISDLMIVD